MESLPVVSRGKGVRGLHPPLLAQDTEAFLPVTITMIKPLALTGRHHLPLPSASATRVASPRQPPFIDVSRTNRCGSLSP